MRDEKKGGIMGDEFEDYYENLTQKCVKDPEECHCPVDCHQKGGKHAVPCCSTCRYCGKERIAIELIEFHENKCPKRFGKETKE